MMNVRQAKTRPKRRTIRKLKKLCGHCRERPAIFIKKHAGRKKTTDRVRMGFPKTDRDHDLCHRCYQSVYDSSRSFIKKFPFL